MRIIGFFILAATLYACNNSTNKPGSIPLDNTDIQKKMESEFKIFLDEGTHEESDYIKAYNKALKLWNVPLVELNVDTKYGRAHVIVSGPKEAEPVVLLHGLYASSTMWYPNMGTLAKYHRIYAIDFLLEPGKSERVGNVKNLEDINAWYQEIFNQLGIDQFNLVGASRGGWLATYLALQQKSRIRNLVLLSPAQTFNWITPGSDALALVTYQVNPDEKNLMPYLETLSENVENIKQPFIDQLLLAGQEKSFDKFILQMRPFSDDELKSLTMPTLVLVGDEDVINDEDIFKKVKNLLPHSETGVIPDAGHFLSIDQADTVNQIILDFLSREIQNEVKKSTSKN